MARSQGSFLEQARTMRKVSRVLLVTGAVMVVVAVVLWLVAGSQLAYYVIAVAVADVALSFVTRSQAERAEREAAVHYGQEH